MEPYRRSFPLPKAFEARYVAGFSLTFLPLFITVAAFVLRHQTVFSLLIVAQLVLALAFFAWTAARRSHKMRSALEDYANKNVALLRSLGTGKAHSEIFPATTGGLLAGGIFAWIRHDIRWLILGGGFFVLVALGLSLRWLVYDRWLDAELAKLERALAG